MALISSGEWYSSSVFELWSSSLHTKCEFGASKVFCITQDEDFNFNNVILVRLNIVMFIFKIFIKFFGKEFLYEYGCLSMNWCDNFI